MRIRRNDVNTSYCACPMLTLDNIHHNDNNDYYFWIYYYCSNLAHCLSLLNHHISLLSEPPSFILHYYPQVCFSESS